MILSDEIMIDMSEQDLVDEHLRGSGLVIPKLDGDKLKMMKMGTAVVLDYEDSPAAPVGADLGYAIQVLEAQCPDPLDDQDAVSHKPGYICHLAMYDFSTFSFMPRPVISFAVHRDDVALECGVDVDEWYENEDEIFECLIDTLADKVARAEEA